MDLIKIGKFIADCRKKKNMTQEQLGEKINVTRQTISNWELDETSHNPEQLKLLSKDLKVNIDELLDNEIKGILVEKVSNTEKLAGIIIKILKFIGIAFIIFLILDFIALICFNVVRKTTNVENGAGTLCTMDNTKYQIELKSSEYFKCDKCSDKMNNDLMELTDFDNIDESISKIEKYFKDSNGTCE